ncbi:helix-turn-helix domain-containing protein [Amycolatopsis acidicola]|uniref:Helix-turn-helix domain-containing protein n=1 Tax=Amycolatopsis acidicola TaxID=2596893 RepID=A0A5N0UXT5_9PSEU|nr:helix-turn-helix domain-containing protein [Amycolatopsis acidicola]KAA9154326.1 helix-turn-helix domain-containing protein [Amycolatopsis acidicola]
MHTVAVLALDQVIPFDLSTPLEVFGRTPGYQVRVCAAEPHVDAGRFTLTAPWGLDTLEDADTVIVPGTEHGAKPVSPMVLDALRGAAARGTRVASICAGTFTLAAAGLLDGLRATTHWLAAGELARMYPTISVDPDVLYVDNGQILTSAGAAAGLDLCLHMIRRDLGSEAAADAARRSVVPLEREGGQAQFIPHELPPAPHGSTLEPVLEWLRANAGRDLTLTEIARQSGMSTRTLLRRFRDQLGSTPLQWLHRVRISQAQHLLETTSESVDHIASLTGFGSPTAFRDRFKRIAGVSPNAYRRSFRA